MAALISREESNQAVENTVLGCESASNSDGESAAECDALSSDVESHDGEEELAGDGDAGTAQLPSASGRAAHGAWAQARARALRHTACNTKKV
jgi:hypothetical protein